MGLRHRPLEDGDADVICRLVQSAEERFFFFPEAADPLTAQQLLDGARDRKTPTVALLDDQIVGYANFIKARPNLFCTLGNLVVSPSHRRSGVATFLVNAMVQMAIDIYAARFVRVACFSHNTAGYQLYHGMGFRPTDMVPRPAPGGEIVLLVNMELSCRRM
jgi:GNAT superfamily N-acetyltransferase